MEMPKPSDAHRKLEIMLGRWAGEEKLFPSPWDAKGGTALGRVHNMRALEGFGVFHDYEQERGGTVNFRGHAVFLFDSKQRDYTMHWFDSYGMQPNLFRGTFEGEVLTVTGPSGEGTARVRFDFREPAAHTMRMEVSQDGHRWTPFMEGRYTKQA